MITDKEKKSVTKLVFLLMYQIINLVGSNREKGLSVELLELIFQKNNGDIDQCHIITNNMLEWEFLTKKGNHFYLGKKINFFNNITLK